MPKKEEEAVEAKNEPIINTEAAKAKAEEIGENAKKGINDAIDKVKSNDNLKIVCCAVVCVVVLLVLVLLLGAGGGSKKPVKDFASGIVKLNEKKICKSMPKEMIEDSFDDLEDCIDTFDELFEDSDDDERPKSYKIEGSKKLDKDDVEDIAEKLEDFDINEKKVKKVVRYKVSFDAKGKDNDMDLYIFSAKIGGKWFVIGASGSKDYRGNMFLS